jgi:pimeloyl-ACP methyl ester carboxylesterase
MYPESMHMQPLELMYKGRHFTIEYSCRRGRNGTVLYLHGLGCSKNDFREAFHRPELEAYTLLAFDFPGCGDSPYPEHAALGIDDLVEITHLVLAALRIKKAVLIGHSMGGLVGLLFAERYNAVVEGFINVEGNLAPEDCFFSRAVAQSDYQQFVTTSFPALKRRLAQEPQIGLRIYAKTLEQASASAYFELAPSLVEYSDHGNLVQRFTALSIPTLFMYGSAKQQLSYLPRLKESDCEVAEIPTSGHFPFHDNPLAFYRAVAAFLQEHYSPRT